MWAFVGLIPVSSLYYVFPFRSRFPVRFDSSRLPIAIAYDVVWNVYSLLDAGLLAWSGNRWMNHVLMLGANRAELSGGPGPIHGAILDNVPGNGRQHRVASDEPDVA